jgi:hypothetical protein
VPAYLKAVNSKTKSHTFFFNFNFISEDQWVWFEDHALSTGLVSEELTPAGAGLALGVNSKIKSHTFFLISILFLKISGYGLRITPYLLGLLARK